MVSSGGGDPPCVSSGVVSCGATGVCAAPLFRGGGLRFGALARAADGRRFAAGRRLALVPRLVAVRCLAVVRRFAVVSRLAVVRRFTGVRFFRDECEVAARFLRFAICCLLSRASLYHFLAKKERRGGHSAGVQPSDATHFHYPGGQKADTTCELNRILIRTSAGQCGQPDHRTGSKSRLTRSSPGWNTPTAMHVL